MTEEIDRILRELPGLTSVGEICKLVDRRHQAGDAGFVAELAPALVRACAGGNGNGQPWQYGSVLGHVVRLLATTPDAGNVALLLRLAAAPQVGGPRRSPYLASLLASGQRPEDLAAVFTEGRSEELRACLLQELVLRGVDVFSVPTVARWVASRHWREHPLAWLPLELTGMEQSPELPAYGPNVESHAVPYGLRQRSAALAQSSRSLLAAEETTTAERAHAMAAAVAEWTDASNGVVEARTFELPRPLHEQQLAGVMEAAGLDCLKGIGPKRELVLSASSAPWIWEVLFVAASSGGAYDPGLYGAYGRLAVWRSLSGLVGTPSSASPQEVEALVRRCTWFEFEADSGWFAQVAWDFGLVCVSPDGLRFSVLAATDTD